jgi:hypothetical protein
MMKITILVALTFALIAWWIAHQPKLADQGRFGVGA